MTSSISRSVSSDGAGVPALHRAGSKSIHGVLDHSRPYARCTISKREALGGTVERETAAVGHTRDRPAGAMLLRIIAEGAI